MTSRRFSACGEPLLFSGELRRISRFRERDETALVARVCIILATATSACFADWPGTQSTRVESRELESTADLKGGVAECRRPAGVFRKRWASGSLRLEGESVVFLLGMS